MAVHKPQLRGAKVSKKIFSVTVAELARVGLERLTIPEVARRAGVNKTSIYRRWPTKEALVKAALGESMEHVRELEDTGTLEGDLHGLIRRVADFIESPRGGAMVRLAFVDSGSRSLRRHAAQAWSDAPGAGPFEILARAVSRGELGPKTDFETLLFTMAGAILHRRFVEQAECDDEWIARVTRLMLRGVAR